MNFYQKIVASLENNKLGFSARKLSAFIVIVMVVILHIKWFRSDEWQYIAEVLGFDYTFILVCLGLATWQQIKQKETPDTNTTNKQDADSASQVN